jgi:WD40 repeat protein
MDKIVDLKFSPRGTCLAVAGRYAPDPGNVDDDSGMLELWDLKAKKKVFSQHTDSPLNSVACSSDGRFLLTGGEDGSVVLWDAATGRRKASFAGAPAQVWGTVFSPDGKIAAAASGWDNGEILLWDIGSGEKVLSLEDKKVPFYSMAFSPGGELLATGCRNKEARLFDSRTGRLLLTLPDHAGWVQSLAFSPDGKTLATGSNMEIRLYDTKRGTLRRTLQDSTVVKSLAFSPDGSRVLSSGDALGPHATGAVARIWDTGSGALKITLRGKHYRACAQFSPDGKWVAVGDFSGLLCIWESSTGKKLAVLGP